MFEKASRLKLRFASPKGQLTVEDLWDLPLTSTTGKANLDDIARGLFKQLKNDDSSISFVKKTAETDNTAQLSFDVVKHIIDVRLAENEVLAKARVNAEKKQQIMAIINQKENEKLAGSSLEELQALLNSM